MTLMAGCYSAVIPLFRALKSAVKSGESRPSDPPAPALSPLFRAGPCRPLRLACVSGPFATILFSYSAAARA